MIVHLYALNYNEKKLLPFFFEHYDNFVDRYFIFDDNSTDGSEKSLLSNDKVELGVFNHGPDSYIEPAREFYKHAWKASQGIADWVIVVNIDEFVHHPKMAEKLEYLHKHKFSAVHCVGWEMVSAQFPTKGPLVSSITHGVRSVPMDKIAMFNPNLVDEIDYTNGRHKAVLSGYANISREHGFKLLHFKFLGFDYLSDRYHELNQRRGSVDVAKNRANKYALPVDQLKARQKRFESASRPVALSGIIKSKQGQKLLMGSFLIKSREIKNDRGGLREIWTQGDIASENIQHIYMTTTLPGAIKAWYNHKEQIDNITIISGTARFVLYDDRIDDTHELKIFDVSALDCQVLTIPKRVWHGFQCISKEPLVMLHHNDRPYNWIEPDEEKTNYDSKTIPYDWKAV